VLFPPQAFPPPELFLLLRCFSQLHNGRGHREQWTRETPTHLCRWRNGLSGSLLSCPPGTAFPSRLAAKCKKGQRSTLSLANPLLIALDLSHLPRAASELAGPSALRSCASLFTTASGACQAPSAHNLKSFPAECTASPPPKGPPRPHNRFTHAEQEEGEPLMFRRYRRLPSRRAGRPASARPRSCSRSGSAPPPRRA
jgi:hypothetical protein